MIDSHCHLAAKEFNDDLDTVILRAHEAGIERMIAIADTIDEGIRSIEIAKKYPEVFATIGVHPHHAKDWKSSDVTKITEVVRSPNKIVAIGEIGLDYHYNLSDPVAQRTVFRIQLELAKELNMPCVVHCREAVEDVWKIVDAVKPPRIVLHCCTERFEDVERFLDRGDLLSFTGMVTYKNADVIRDTVLRTPIEEMMIETDAPFLAPVPHRGKRNEPAFVSEVLKTIAEIKGLSLDEADLHTTKNAVEFFRLPT